MSEVLWRVAEISGPGGDVVARFRIDSCGILGDPSYAKALWVQVDSPADSDLDQVLEHLNAVEDDVAKIVESKHGARLLVTLTGADYRDLVFAVPKGDEGVLRDVRKYAEMSGLLLGVQLHPGQKFGPYAALVRRAARTI